MGGAPPPPPPPPSLSLSSFPVFCLCVCVYARTCAGTKSTCRSLISRLDIVDSISKTRRMIDAEISTLHALLGSEATVRHPARPPLQHLPTLPHLPTYPTYLPYPALPCPTLPYPTYLPNLPLTFFSCFLSFSLLSVCLFLSLSFSLFLSLFLSFSSFLFLSPSHTHTHTHTLFFFLSLSLSFSFSLFLSFSSSSSFPLQGPKSVFYQTKEKIDNLKLELAGLLVEQNKVYRQILDVRMRMSPR